MSHRFVQRCAAVLLLSVLGSGFVLPGLDELLYHRGPANARADLVHVDRAGGCDSHAEHCIAGPTLRAPRLAAVSSPALPIHAVGVVETVGSGKCDPFNSNRQTPQQPRAPPTA